MQYRTCPYCGAHLDFGESCDCKPDRQRPKQLKPKPIYRAHAELAAKYGKTAPSVSAERSGTRK